MKALTQFLVLIAFAVLCTAGFVQGFGAAVVIGIVCALFLNYRSDLVPPKTTGVEDALYKQALRTELDDINRRLSTLNAMLALRKGIDAAANTQTAAALGGIFGRKA